MALVLMCLYIVTASNIGNHQPIRLAYCF